jgi:hypothetical protein
MAAVSVQEVQVDVDAVRLGMKSSGSSSGETLIRLSRERGTCREKLGLGHLVASED